MAEPTLFIAGAGHVGRAVAELAVWLGYRVVVWDDRRDVLAELPGTVRTLESPMAEAVAEVPVTTETAVVVLTRNVDLDLQILPVLLATGARYVGLMGSRRRWSTTRRALLAAGVPEAELRRVSSPVGIELHAETPEEIAVSVLAEVAGRRGT